MIITKLDWSSWTKQVEDKTYKQIDLDLDNSSLWVCFETKSRFIEPYWEQIISDMWDILYNFEELEDRYIINNHELLKSDVVSWPRFYELQERCFHCEKYVAYSDIINKDIIYYPWDKKEFTRKYWFCSEECIEKYLKENDCIME